MLTLTQTTAWHAAVLTNFIYGAIILLINPGRRAMPAEDTLWILATGAAGHAIYAFTTHGSGLPNDKSAATLMLDILLICASLWMLIISAPALYWAAITGLHMLPRL